MAIQTVIKQSAIRMASIRLLRTSHSPGTMGSSDKSCVNLFFLAKGSCQRNVVIMAIPERTPKFILTAPIAATRQPLSKDRTFDDTLSVSTRYNVESNTDSRPIGCIGSFAKKVKTKKLITCVAAACKTERDWRQAAIAMMIVDRIQQDRVTNRPLSWV